MTENEKELHAMEFLDWALRHNALLYDLQEQCIDNHIPDYIELLQLLYNQGFYEACVLCVLLAKESAFVSSAMSDTVQELVRSKWNSQGTKKMLENFIVKIQSASERFHSKAQKITEA